MKLFDLSGKVAIITGSSRGIGRAIAEAFAEAGGRVVISARNAAPCEEVAATIRANGGEAISVTARISDKAQLENLVAKTREAWGRVDILVCNAAINPHYGSLEQLTDEVFERMMVNNVLSNLWLSRMVGPEMRARRDGAIIYMISTAALRAEITTLPPASANAPAIARPMPRLEPVMIATFPDRSNSFMTPLQAWIVVTDHAGSSGFSKDTRAVAGERSSMTSVENVKKLSNLIK